MMSMNNNYDNDDNDVLNNNYDNDDNDVLE